MDIIRTWFNGIVIASLGTVSIPVILLWALFVPFLDVPGLVVSVKFTNEKPAEVETEAETVEEDEEETYAEEKPIQVSEDEEDEEDEKEEDNEEADEKPVPETPTDPNLIDAESNANKADNTEETDDKNTILPDVQEPEPILSETALKDAMTDLYSKKTE